MSYQSREEIAAKIDKLSDKRDNLERKYKKISKKLEENHWALIALQWDFDNFPLAQSDRYIGGDL